MSMDDGITKLDYGATNPSSYMTDAFVYQLGRGASKGNIQHLIMV